MLGSNFFMLVPADEGVLWKSVKFYTTGSGFYYLSIADKDESMVPAGQGAKTNEFAKDATSLDNSALRLSFGVHYLYINFDNLLVF